MCEKSFDIQIEHIYIYNVNKLITSVDANLILNVI